MLCSLCLHKNRRHIWLPTQGLFSRRRRQRSIVRVARKSNPSPTELPLWLATISHYHCRESYIPSLDSPLKFASAQQSFENWPLFPLPLLHRKISTSLASSPVSPPIDSPLCFPCLLNTGSNNYPQHMFTQSSYHPYFIYRSIYLFLSPLILDVLQSEDL